MRKFWGGLVAGLVIVGALVWTGHLPRWLGVSSDVAQGEFGFALKDEAGRVRRWEEFRGKPVVLHFWAAWCAPCLEEIHAWVAVAKRFEGQPIQWLAISLDPDWASARTVLPTQGLPSNVTYLLDPEKKVSDRIGSYQFPETYLFDANLKRLAKWVGPQDWEGAGMLQAIEGLVSKKESGN